jgi:hypothetical protein
MQIDFGQVYGGPGPHYITQERQEVTMYCKLQAVRFYTNAGEQVGPEQPNVCGAVSYAMHRKWYSTRPFFGPQDEATRRQYLAFLRTQLKREACSATEEE